jgi:hypothetical protein
VGQFQMGYSRVLGAPQTGSISMHVLLSFSTNLSGGMWFFWCLATVKLEQSMDISIPDS